MTYNQHIMSALYPRAIATFEGLALCYGDGDRPITPQRARTLCRELTAALDEYDACNARVGMSDPEAVDYGTLPVPECADERDEVDALPVPVVRICE